MRKWNRFRRESWADRSRRVLLQKAVEIEGDGLATQLHGLVRFRQTASCHFISIGEQEVKVQPVEKNTSDDAPHTWLVFVFNMLLNARQVRTQRNKPVRVFPFSRWSFPLDIREPLLTHVSVDGCPLKW